MHFKFCCEVYKAPGIVLNTPWPFETLSWQYKSHAPNFADPSLFPSHVIVVTRLGQTGRETERRHYDDI